MDADKMVDIIGNMPPEFMYYYCFSVLKPFEQGIEKYIKFFKNIDDKKYVDNFLRVEKWLGDTPPIPGELFKQWIKDIYQKNLPNNSTCKLLYDLSEKIRYEILGAKMLKGVSKNLKDNYSNKITLKRKDQLKSKEDVQIAEAFELYMLKNFLDIKLNKLSEKILSFQEMCNG